MLCATVLVLHVQGGITSALIMLYPLLIAGSGLWCSARLVWICTGAAMACYLFLWFEAVWLESLGQDPSVSGETRYHIVFLASLALMGLVTALQVRRMRPMGDPTCDPA